MSKKFCRFSNQKPESSSVINQKTQVEHPPDYYLGRKKAGLVLFEMLVVSLRRNKTFSNLLDEKEVL